MKFLPRFVRRAVLLKRARDLVESGDGRAALVLLADPLFDGVPAARELARQAETQVPAHATGTRASITELLAQLREERARRGGGVNGFTESPSRSSNTTTTDFDAAVAAAKTRGASTVTSVPPRIAFRLAVDDAGEFQVVVGLDFTIGHESSLRADLRLLAHIEREHARIHFSNDFHAGPAWRIEPIGRARVTVDAREVGSTGRVLYDGDHVVLGPRSSFRFSSRDMTSASAVLELEHGLECHGAGRILLVAPGADGRVTIGGSKRCTIRANGFEHDVTLEVTLTTDTPSEARLAVGCTAGLARGVRPGEGAPTSLSIVIPPRVSERFTFSARSATEAPFEIVAAPLPAGNESR